MRTSTRMTLAAGWAAALGAVPIGAVFDTWSWVWFTWAAVAAVVAAHLLARSVRLPALLVPVVGALGLLLYLTVVFAGEEAFAGLLPTWPSLRALVDGFSGGFADVHDLAAPVPATAGLVLITAASVGGLAIVLDVVAVTLRRPAAAGLAMLALYAVPAAVARDGVGWPLFVVGAAGYLVLLMVEGRDRLLRWGRPVSAGAVPGSGSSGGVAGVRDDDAPLPLTGQRIGAMALAIAVIAPLFVPGLTANALGELGRTGTGDGGGNGRGVAPIGFRPFAELKGELLRPQPRQLFTVTTDNTELYYLRSTVLESFTAAGWVRTTFDDSGAAAGGLRSPNAQPEVSTPARRYEATVKVSANYGGDTLPTFFYPSSVDGLTPDWRWDATTASVTNRRARANSQEYRLVGVDARPTRAELEASGFASRDDATARQLLSTDNVPDAVRQLVERITAGLDTPFARASALHRYFLDPPNGFLYSTQTKDGSSGSLLVDFLANKRGFCEQYAAALGIMLRVAEVPSRVVLGFTHPQGGDGQWNIMSSDAHAWTEGYFPGVGWVAFDATPREYSGQQSLPYAPVRTPAPAPTVSGSSVSASPGVGASGRLDPDLQNPGSLNQQPGLVTPRSALVSLGVLALVTLLLAPSVARRVVRRRRLRLAGSGGDARASGRAAWDELLGTAADYRVAVPSTETPRGTAARLGRELSLRPAALAGLRLLALAEERARYAPTAGVDGDLPAAVREMRRGMRDTVGRRSRLRAALFPPSTVGAGLVSAARRGGRASASLSRLGEELRRIFDPRRLSIRRGSGS